MKKFYFSLINEICSVSFSKIKLDSLHLNKNLKIFFILSLVSIFSSNNYPYILTSTQISIKEARIDRDSNFIPDKLGEYVTVAGRVTVPSGLLDPDQLQIFIQDSTAGISVYSLKYTGKPIKLGDSIVVTGKIGQYAGLVEIQNPIIKIIENAKTFVPKPLKIINYHNLEAYEGMLVKISARVVDKGLNRGGRYYIVVPKFGSYVSLMLFISKYQTDRKLFGNYENGEVINIEGVVGQYDYDETPNSNYQIIPRFSDDISIIQHNSSYYFNIIFIFVGLLLIISLFTVYLKYQVNKKTKHLIESERRFSSLAENTSSAIVIYKNEYFVYANKAAEKLTGYSENEFKKLKFWEIVHPDFKDLVKQRGIERQNGVQVPNRYEFKIINKEGNDIWIDFTAGSINWKGESAAIGTAFDITLRKLGEDEIRKLYRGIEQSPASIIITDINGNIEYVNSMVINITGYQLDEIIGKNPRIFSSGEKSKAEYKVLWDTLLSGKVWYGELHNKKKNGELYWESASISPIMNDNGEITNFIGIKENITDRKQMISELIEAKDKAEEMNRAKSSFFSNMSHELRTPLIGILGFSDLLKIELENSNLYHMADTINVSGNRLLNTLNLILQISKIDSSKFEIKFEDFNIGEIINEVANLWKASADKKRLNLTIESPVELLNIKSDKQLIYEILNNLISNAIKYTENGEIKVRFFQTDADGNSWITIQVIDTGIGISEENLKIIFQEFRQASEGYSRSFEGAGLGLTISKRLTEALGGSISVESKLGVGTMFQIKLPADNSNASVSTIENSNSILPIIESKNNKYVKNKNSCPELLLVEDDPVSADVTKLFLRNDYIISTCNNADSAVQLVSQNKYAAILMDINLGVGKNGLDAAKEIKILKEYSDIPIIALTAYAMQGDKEKFLIEGCTHYLSKPFTKGELIAILQEAMISI